MGLPRYIINYDELAYPLKVELLTLIDEEIRNTYPQINTHNIAAMMEELERILPDTYYKDIKHKIEALIFGKLEGTQKSEGARLDIPPIKGKYKQEFKFHKDVLLTGLHVDQSGWKKEDRYHLKVDKDFLINNATIKEVGEHKYLNTFCKVNAETPIYFILDNNSGNSREVIIDLDYLEGTQSNVIVPPPNVSVEEYWVKQIPNLWDFAVVMNWEKGDADIDLHGFIDNDHIYFKNRSARGVYLNFDYRSHEDTTNPEIISVKGNYNKKLFVYVRNYNGAALKTPVTIRIYGKDVMGNPRLKKEFKININMENKYLNGVCVIDINTLKIEPLNKQLEWRD